MAQRAEEEAAVTVGRRASTTRHIMARFCRFPLSHECGSVNAIAMPQADPPANGGGDAADADAEPDDEKSVEVMKLRRKQA